MINNKTFDHLPMSQLFAIVKGDFKKLNAEGLIDEGRLVKKVMWCNEKLGIPIRELKECAIPVENYAAKLPLDFDKLYFICGLNETTKIAHVHSNPFDNNFDSDVIYEAKLDRQSIGGVSNYQVTINKLSNVTVHTSENWISLNVDKSSHTLCHSNCPNISGKGNNVRITEEEIYVPFEKGMVYIMYLGNMRDKEGNLLFPFHPLITPWYEWCLKEQILMDAIFNSEGNYSDQLALATRQKMLAWADAFNITTEKEYGYYVDHQKRKEQEYFNKYFKTFK